MNHTAGNSTTHHVTNNISLFYCLFDSSVPRPRNPPSSDDVTLPVQPSTPAFQQPLATGSSQENRAPMSATATTVDANHANDHSLLSLLYASESIPFLPGWGNDFRADSHRPSHYIIAAVDPSTSPQPTNFTSQGSGTATANADNSSRHSVRSTFNTPDLLTWPASVNHDSSLPFILNQSTAPVSFSQFRA